MAPSVVGLVLNYNGLEVTLQTLESLLQLDYPQLELVVVDNGSTDGSYEAIRAAHPGLRQLRVGTNRGISWGLDHGIQWALERGCDYVLLMNNDIEVAPSMLAEMVAVAEGAEDIGCVGPKCYYYFDRGRLWSAGGTLRFREAITRERGDGQLDRGQFDNTEEVDYINGCAMLVRRAALETVGYWDPVFYLGVEDADFCVRLRRGSFRCVYAHRAVLWHMISHSIGVYRPSRTFHTARSTALFLRKHARPWNWATSILFFVASLPVAYVRELFEGNQTAVVAKWRGFVEGLRVELRPIPDRFDDLLLDEPLAEDLPKDR